MRNDVRRSAGAALRPRRARGASSRSFSLSSGGRRALVAGARWRGPAGGRRQGRSAPRSTRASSARGRRRSATTAGARSRFDRPLDARRCSSRIGHTPLPPVHPARGRARRTAPEDRAAYQTVFAREPLAVAAPTAGLHFTMEPILAAHARARRRDRGPHARRSAPERSSRSRWTTPMTITLLHLEDVSRSPSAARAAIARAQSRRDGASWPSARRWRARSRRPTLPRRTRRRTGELRFATDLFITPGFEFQCRSTRC